MRFLAVLPVLVACATVVAPPPVEEVNGPVCLPFTRHAVRVRSEGTVAQVEWVRTTMGCDGPAADVVETLARIEASAATDVCPVGQVALRTWERGQGSEAVRPALLSSLDEASHLALAQALSQFAESAAAVVIACPAPGRADWLLVDTAPRGEPPRLSLFLANVLSSDRSHPAVTFGDGPAPPASPAPPTRPATSAIGEPVAPAECNGLPESMTTRWSARFLSTGVTPGPDFRRDFLFGRNGTKAALAIEVRRTLRRDDPGPAREWMCERAVLLTGTLTARGEGFEFRLVEEGSADVPRTVTCTTRSLRVANAHAVRVEIASEQEGCHKHRWSPAATQRVQALECRLSPSVADETSADEAMGEAGWVDWTFDRVFISAAPGLEHLTLDEDDCWDPADSLRFVPADGSIAPVK